MTIYNWLCVLGIPGLFTALFAFIKLQFRQNKAVKLGLQALLRDRLLQAFKHYEQEGGCTFDEKRNVENLYLQYESLGENGIMTSLYENFLSLPIK